MIKIILSTFLFIPTSIIFTACSKDKVTIEKSYERSSQNIKREQNAYQDLNNELKK